MVWREGISISGTGWFSIGLGIFGVDVALGTASTRRALFGI
jgi:hypothetical protein